MAQRGLARSRTKALEESLAAEGQRPEGEEEDEVGEACALVGHDDGRLQLVDVATGKELKLFAGHKDYLTCVDVCWPKALSAAADGAVFLWSLEEGTGIELVPPEELPASCIRTLKADWHDKKLAVSGNDDGYLVIWNLVTQEAESILNWHKDRVTALSVNWKLKRGQDKSVRLWNMQRSECIRVVSGHLLGLRCLCVDWDLGVALSSAWDGEMQLWEIADEVDMDFALQPVGGEVRAGGVALLIVKEGEGKEEHSDEEVEEIEADTFKSPQSKTPSK
ncbi:unnamed protein product [Effrenium voratum]|nr:unnamed protein product [Effrenium voratum]